MKGTINDLMSDCRGGFIGCEGSVAEDGVPAYTFAAEGFEEEFEGLAGGFAGEVECCVCEEVGGIR